MVIAAENKKGGVMDARLTLRIPSDVHSALKKATKKRNITMSRYLLRLIVVSLIKEGFLDNMDEETKVDIFHL